MMTRRSHILWAIALVAMLVGTALLRMGDGLRAQATTLDHAKNATQREIARIQTGADTPIPLATHFIARGLVASATGDNINLERVGANDALNALLDFERRGLGTLARFTFAFPEPGRLSGSVSSSNASVNASGSPLPAAQK